MELLMHLGKQECLLPSGIVGNEEINSSGKSQLLLSNCYVASLQQYSNIWCMCILLWPVLGTIVNLGLLYGIFYLGSFCLCIPVCFCWVEFCGPSFNFRYPTLVYIFIFVVDFLADFHCLWWALLQNHANLCVCYKIASFHFVIFVSVMVLYWVYGLWILQGQSLFTAIPDG